MTLHELRTRADGHARRRRVTFESLFMDCGVRPSTFRRAQRGLCEMRRATARRLLGLVALVIRPGEPVCLEIDGRTICAAPATPARDAAAHSPS